jgi:hypothetical protein
MNENPTYDFDKKLAFSQGKRAATDLDTLKQLIPDHQEIVLADIEEDLSGIDYIVTLNGGAKILVDAKTREPGCSKWWKNGPELALEKWSVMPGGEYKTPIEKSRIGWTLNMKNQTDLILFTFPPKDSCEVFLISFPLLRKVFRRNIDQWWTDYKTDIQKSNRGSKYWESACVFVPAQVVLDSITNLSRGHFVPTEKVA